MRPTIGRIVHYFPSDEELKYFGSNASPLPATITRVWSEHCVNLKVHTDGPTDVWKTSVDDHDGASPRWQWPKREE